MTVPEIDQPVRAPIRDEIAFWLMILGKHAHNIFSVFSCISPNSERAITTMELVPEKDGIRFSTRRIYNGKALSVGGSFFMKRHDLENALSKLEELKNDRA